MINAQVISVLADSLPQPPVLQLSRYSSVLSSVILADSLPQPPILQLSRYSSVLSSVTLADSLPQPPVLHLNPPPVPTLAPAYQDSLAKYTNSFFHHLGDSIQQYTANMITYSRDTAELSLQQKEKMEWKLEVFKSKMADSQKELEQKIKAWEKEIQPKIKAFERKMKAWQKENEPKIKEFESKMEAWVKAQSKNFGTGEEKNEESVPDPE
jgi:hypothetical protein